jgi:nitrite reductase [NAD(P)H] small subunit
MLLTDELRREKRKMTTYNLGPADVIPLGEGKAFALGDHTVAVFRTRQGALYATQHTCPHKQGPLADGTIGGTTLTCPLHGFKYDLASGRALGHDCGALTTYPVHINEAGEILVHVGVDWGLGRRAPSGDPKPQM